MLGENIRGIRKQKKMSINKLSKLSGISLGYLSDLENNNAKNPTMEKLQSIATALDVPVSELLDNEEKLVFAIDSINKIAKLAENGLSYKVSEREDSNYSLSNDSLMTVFYDFKDERFSEEEQKEISNYIKYVISKRDI